MTKNTHKLGSLTREDISFPKYLTPEIIHSALFVHNAPTTEDIKTRVEYCAKQIGDESMSYAMALLVLPTLMNNMEQSADYAEWKKNRHKRFN